MSYTPIGKYYSLITLYSDMLANKWFRNNMVQTVVELMFYNKNSDIGINMQLIFFESNTGNFSVTMQHLIFLPQNYIRYQVSSLQH